MNIVRYSLERAFGGISGRSWRPKIDCTVGPDSILDLRNWHAPASDVQVPRHSGTSIFFVTLRNWAMSGRRRARACRNTQNISVRRSLLVQFVVYKLTFFGQERCDAWSLILNVPSPTISIIRKEPSFPCAGTVAPPGRRS